MYLRISKGRQKSYLVIVQGYREDGKVKQRTILNLGPIDPETSKQCLSLGKKLLNQFGASALIDGSEISETLRNNWGAYKVLQRLWEIYNLKDFWDKKLDSRKIQYDLQDILQLMIAGRLSSPSSKLALYENQAFYDGFDKVELHTFYKALDELDYYKELLSQHLFGRQQEIHGQLIIAFFDVTTMYFESVKSDDLRAFGFSKDCKFGEVQVVLSLLSDSKGNPLAYELFPGNTAEGSTFIDCLALMKEKYKIQKATLVADRGMYSSGNLEAVISMGYDYIVGTKLRKSPAQIKEEVLATEGYKQGSSGDFKYKLISRNRGEGHDESIVASWSKPRADKDAKDRLRLVEKAMKLLRTGKIDDKRGGKKYLKSEKSKPELDHEKIMLDAEWDGFYGVSTNSKLDPEQVLEAYHNLWRIEEDFRIMKDYFQTRPMFHWTPKRISGHIMLNFMAMIFERYLENSLAQSNKKLSAQKIRVAINEMQKSVLNIDGKAFVSYAKLPEPSLRLLQTLSIPIPKSSAIN